MTAIANLPDLRPSLLLDFANSGRVDPRIQCTRASAATCFGPDGKLRTVAANVPRIDYDPVTGKCRGLLVEEGRTNSLLWSGSVAQTPWLKTNVSVESAVVITNGISLQKVIGNSGSDNTHVQASVPHVVGSMYSFSAVVMAAGMRFAHLRVLGAVSSITRAIFDLSTGTVSSSSNVSYASVESLGAGLYRLSVGFTTALAGNINARVQMSLDANTTLPADGVSGMYIGAAQVEQATSATSYIPTEASAVTRAADVPVLQEQLMPAFGTMLVKYRKVGWKYTNKKPVGNLDLSKQVDTEVQISDHIERALLYPRQLTAAQLQRLTAL